MNYFLLFVPRQFS